MTYRLFCYSRPRTTRSNIQFRSSVLAWMDWQKTTILLVAMFAVSGCNRSNPYLTSSPSGFLIPSAAPGLANPQFPVQLAERERQIKLSDENNRQLTTQLAQSQQQTQLHKERADLLQRQLQDTSNQLQQTSQPKEWSPSANPSTPRPTIGTECSIELFAVLNSKGGGTSC